MGDERLQQRCALRGNARTTRRKENQEVYILFFFMHPDKSWSSKLNFPFLPSPLRRAPLRVKSATV